MQSFENNLVIVDAHLLLWGENALSTLFLLNTFRSPLRNKYTKKMEDHITLLHNIYISFAMLDQKALEDFNDIYP